MRRSKEDAKKSTGNETEMITPALRKALTKQGYRLVGSHSGVKLCRWTKVWENYNCRLYFIKFSPDVLYSLALYK